VGDDYYVWPDGTWCYGHDIEEYLTFMSMDFKVLKVGTLGWLIFHNNLESEGYTHV
jgi:hypothetical protein